MLKTAPRLSRVPRTEAPPAVAEIYDRFMRSRGSVPNMFRTMAHRPEIFATMIAHFEAVLNTGTLPPRLKEQNRDQAANFQARLNDIGARIVPALSLIDRHHRPPLADGSC